MEDQIQAEHVAKLYDEAAIPIAAHLATALATAALLWHETGFRADPLLGAWLAAMVIACIARAYTLMRYARSPRQQADWRHWRRTGIVYPALFGLIWAAAIMAFFDIDNPTSAMMLTVIPIGIAAAATATNASVPPAFYAVEIPISAALVLVTFGSGTLLGYTIGGLTLVTAWLRVRICNGIHAAYDRSLRIGYENLELRREAERANAAKTRFLAAASHDLRQPIHALGLSFSALSHEVSGERARGLVAQVEGCIAAVTKMLEALLDISKLDAGVVRPEYASVDAGELLRRLEAELSTLAQQTGNRLRLRLPARPLPALRTDPAMLESILRNLIGNALSYTRDGGVLVALRRRAAGVEIAVVDNGIGIAGHQLEEIFTEFRQLHDGRREGNQGLGLGLSIVKRLSALLGCRIQVRSRQGRGSCFRLTIPGPLLAPQAAPAVSGERVGGAVSWLGPAARVLVVDDDALVRDAMAALLSGWGYRVHCAEHLEQALALGAREGYDVAILDYRLGDGVTGADVLEALQRQRGGPVPALLVTGDTAPDRLQEAQALGLPLLHKPVKPARLRAALRHLSAEGR
ncbi:MAG: hybrid sensor histidine kinase/response regulator [Thiohalocapsa sp.]|nr:hybrid sensor histidine kinase/response regulator [Thiohalocapsa sp.]